MVQPETYYGTKKNGETFSVTARDASTELNYRQIEDAFNKLQLVIQEELNRLAGEIEKVKLGNDVIKVADKNLESTVIEVCKFIRGAYNFKNEDVHVSLNEDMENFQKQIEAKYDEIQTNYNNQAKEERTRKANE